MNIAQSGFDYNETLIINDHIQYNGIDHLEQKKKKKIKLIEDFSLNFIFNFISIGNNHRN